MLKEWRSYSEYVHPASKGAAKVSILVISRRQNRPPTSPIM
jgi:hypothetical protein